MSHDCVCPGVRAYLETLTVLFEAGRFLAVTAGLVLANHSAGGRAAVHCRTRQGREDDLLDGNTRSIEVREVRARGGRGVCAMHTHRHTHIDIQPGQSLT